LEAYRLVGYIPARKFGYVLANVRKKNLHKVISNRIEAEFKNRGLIVYNAVTGCMDIGGRLNVYLLVVRARRMSGGLRWLVTVSPDLDFDVLVLARLDEEGDEIKDFYILPEFSLPGHEFRLSEDNGAPLDLFRHSDMNPLYDLVGTDG
jgi:hypothetical protein